MDPVTTLRSIIYLGLLVHSALAYDDYSSSCMRPGRTSKAWPEPPCDFKNQAWCTAPGSAYPWHAVRRFVHENQGLMRRMYGDMRQISVLRAEYESNDVLYHGDGADFQLIRDGVTKRYRPVTERSTPTSTTSVNRARPSSTTTSTSTVRTTSTVSTPISTVSSTTKISTTSPKKQPVSTSTTTTTTTTVSPTSSTTDTSIMTEIVTDDTTLTSTTSGSTLDTTLALEEREKEIAEVVEALEVSTEDDNQFSEPDEDDVDDQLAAESELTYEEEEEDIADEEEPAKQQPQMLRRGVNACPVKEEVVAPFWANNTRGEILALLNLYPFEQYVHWEKCTDEHQQMFCRDGCRCEQQYRLHRLLAYDPRNECRGIFSDWFKFPSCCVCKCYDIPPEFRLTSRSPRRGNTKSNNNIVNKKVIINKNKLRLEEDDSIPINGLESREDGGEMRADLQAVVHHSDKPHRPGRGYFETATIGPVDAATPHFYYQPPASLLQLSRRPRNA